MNAIFTVAILALAMFAACEAVGLKDSVNLCDDDVDLTAANKALLLTNKVEQFANNENIKDWLWCYYTDLNILQRQSDDDTSEMLCRKSFVLQYPSMWVSGNAALQNCNKQIKNIKSSDDKAYAYHKCVVAAGFKL